jgi:hypothetical protein
MSSGSVNPDGSITDSALQQKVVSYLAAGFTLADIANCMTTGVPPVSMTVVKYDGFPLWRLVSDTFITLSLGGTSVLLAREQKTIFGHAGSLERPGVFDFMKMVNQVKEDFSKTNISNLRKLVDAVLFKYSGLKEEDFKAKILEMTPEIFHLIIHKIFQKVPEANEGCSAQP